MLQLFLFLLAGQLVVGADAYWLCPFLRHEPSVVARLGVALELNHQSVRPEAGESEHAKSREMTGLWRRFRM